MCSEPHLQTADVGVGGVVTSACVDLTSHGIAKKRKKRFLSVVFPVNAGAAWSSSSNWGMLKK